MSKEKKNTETATEAVNKKPTTKAQTVMYIGPSIPNVVQASTVFKDGILTETLEKCVKEKPYMKKLLVPLEELPAAMRELNGNSAISSIYRRVKMKFKEE